MHIKATIARPVVAFMETLGHAHLRKLGRAQWADSVPRESFRPEWHDLWFLYRTVRKYRPGIVMEFGSGCSTPVIAGALADNGGGTIHTVEAFPQWLETTRHYFPPDLLPRCEFVASAPVESMHDGRKVWRHSIVPDVVPDMIYLDGPPLTKERPVSVDVLDMEPRLKSGCVLVVDGRKENFGYLRMKLKRRWRFEWHRWSYRGFAQLQ